MLVLFRCNISTLWPLTGVSVSGTSVFGDQQSSRRSHDHRAEEIVFASTPVAM